MQDYASAPNRLLMFLDSSSLSSSSLSSSSLVTVICWIFESRSFSPLIAMSWSTPILIAFFTCCWFEVGLLFSGIIFASNEQFFKEYRSDSASLLGWRTLTKIWLFSSNPSSRHRFNTQRRRLLSEKYHGPSSVSGPTITWWKSAWDQVYIFV